MRVSFLVMTAPLIAGGGGLLQEMRRDAMIEAR